MKRSTRSQDALSANATDGWWIDWGLIADANGEAKASVPAHVIAEAVVAPAPATAYDAKTAPDVDLVADAIMAPALAPPTDTNFGQQWNLTGPWGINVLPVWDDYTGAGVKVAVYDSGIDWNHPDLAGRVDQSLSLNTTTGAAGGLPVENDDNHGTAVAGLIAGARNGNGIVGVAYDSPLISLHTGFSEALPGDDVLAFNHARLHADVMNNSWGYVQTFSDDFSGPFAAEGAALAAAAAQGRGGLGTVIVQSAGNERGLLGDANFHNFSNNRHVVTVGASLQDGSIAPYSSTGASILVSAPGSGQPGSIITTDRVGSPGYSTGDFTTTFNGTSAAAPQVSGVVALMLEANSALGYRDVQEILAYSARMGSTTAGYEHNGATNWNGGGLHFSEDFGAGLLDARAAVRLAETWTTQRTSANEQSVTATASPSLPIGTQNTVSSSLANTVAVDLDFVEVTVDISIPARGDLIVQLTSPSGVTSTLMDRSAALTTSGFWVYDTRDNLDWTFGSTQHWGESGVGSWTLTVTDSDGGSFGSLNSWTLRLYGDAPTTTDTYVYTDEFSETFARDAAHATQRTTLDDTDGGIDTLNAAALSGAAAIRLDGGMSTIDGHAISIVANVIENAYAGDGNDTLAGTSAANSLSGGRGDDTLIVDAGDDWLEGGAGVDLALFTDASARLEVDLASGATISVGVLGNDTLIGFEGLGGGSGDDYLSGTSGANQLIGGGGNDTLRGREGDDTYGVDSAFDIIIEDDGGGRDLVRSAVDYELLGSYVEDLALVGATARIGTGNAEANRLYGSDHASTLQGLGGHDTLYGGLGDDWLIGDDGNDILDGGAGQDSIQGGDGDDTYLVDQSTDMVAEGSGGGSDTIISSADFTSTIGVEVLILTGTASILGIGNADAETILGNAGNNELFGMGGNDSLSGGSGNDTLYGGADNDYMDGGSGADYMGGGHGNDRYVVNSLSDIVSESAGDGTDTILSVLSIALPTGVENLTLLGSASADGTGNALDNTLLGNAAGNTLVGGDGNDTIDGAAGPDGLFGGIGDDVLLVDDADIAVDGGSGTDVAVFSGLVDVFTAAAWQGIERYDLSGGDDVFAPAASVTTAPPVTPSTISLGALDGTNGFRVLAPATNAWFGHAVAGVGDVNGDGRDDFAVGASNSTEGVTVVFGRAGGWDASLNPFQLTASSGLHLAGFKASAIEHAGDVNGDDIDDMIIGVSSSNTAYVVFGQQGGWSTPLDVGTLDGTNGFAVTGTGRLGNSVSTAGDINGDGYDDVIVGATDAHRSYVVFGHSGAWNALVNVSSLDGTNGAVLVGADGSHVGDSVVGAGDVNGDGYDDVLTLSAWADNGTWYLVNGHAGGWSPTVSLADLNGVDGTRFMVRPGQSLGASQTMQVASAGDVNGDGLDDFLLGAHRAGSGGATYLVFGSAAGWGSTLNVSALNGTNGAAILGAVPNGLFGVAVDTAGDMNGDGFADFIVGARDAETSRIVFGHAGGWPASVVESLIASSGTVLLTGATGVLWTGWSVSTVGDVNGDGADDVIVGAPYSGSIHEGAAYVVFGWPGATTPAADRSFTVAGGEGNDTISGRSLADSLAGGAGIDVLYGAAGDDTLGGDQGDDTIVGGAGNDSLFGGAGIDKLAGGEGNDFYRLDDAGVVDETAAGSGGIDTVAAAYSGHTLAEGVEIGAVWFSGDGMLSGSSTANTLLGAAARDTLRGMGGADTLYGFSGDDQLDGGEGADTLRGGAGDDTYRVDDADLVAEAAIETLHAQSRITGELIAWNVSAGATMPTTMARPGIGWAWTGRADFNGDGQADNLFRHLGTGENLVWYLDDNNAQIGSANLSMSHVDTRWRIAGVGDFTGDGKADILWRHQGAGLTSLWQMNGVTATATTLLPIQVDSTWQIAAVADFTGDGKLDILWRQPTAGLTSVWQMDGVAPVATTLVSASAPVGWEIGAVGDFTGDGKADIAWRTTEGGGSLWQMDGATRVATTTSATILPGGEWTVVATASGGGHDRVESSSSRILDTGVEDLTLTGSAAITALGNSLDNVLTGNAAANLLIDSAGGHDTMFGGDGADSLFGGVGNDLLYGGDSVGDIDTLYGDSGNDVAYAGLGADVAYGGEGSDTLHGGGGIDTIYGGAGGDVFGVDDASDVVIEAAETPASTLFGQNRITGEIASWDATSGLGAQTAMTRPGLGWLWAGRGDFNGDGVTDNLFRHVITGDNRVWYLDASGAKSGEADLSLSPIDTAWNIAGVGDFTGDGAADILWRHSTAGYTSLWQMDGVSATATTLLPVQVGTDWQIAGVADFTGDDKMDILWRHAAAGYTSLWQMDGANPVNFGLLSALAPVGWQVGAVGDFSGDGKADIAWRTGGGSELWEMNGTTRVGVTTPTSALPDSDWMTIGQEWTTITDRDRVESSVSYTLGTGVEDLTLAGATAINGTGNATDNTLIGNSAVNTLTGGAGNDQLTGGGGDDVFAYASGDGDDAITDFDAGDRVDLSGVSFDHAGVTANIAVLSDGHSITAQIGYVWTGSDFV